MVRTIVSGERQRIDFYVALNPDCTPQGYVTVRIVTPHVHDELTTERGVDYPLYDHRQVEGNRAPADAVALGDFSLSETQS
jgi:hypothetical protein